MWCQLKKKDHTGMAPSSYKSGKRCKCVKADLQCSDICNCNAQTFAIAMDSAREESVVVCQGRQKKEMVGKEKHMSYKRQKHGPATKNSWTG